MSFSRKQAAQFVECKTHIGKLVLMALSEYANDKTGLASPSLSILARDCQLSVKSVQRALTELRGLGYITRVDDYGDSNPRRARCYCVELDALTSDVDSTIRFKDSINVRIKGGQSMPSQSIDEKTNYTPTGHSLDESMPSQSIDEESHVTIDIKSNGDSKGKQGRSMPSQSIAKTNGIAERIATIPNLNREAWGMWIEYRKARGLPKYATDREAKKLAKLPQAEQLANVEHSITKNYNGIWGAPKQRANPDMLTNYNKIRAELNQ